jgi:acyl-coenzyme A thioesterase PaaI-like protein
MASTLFQTLTRSLSPVTQANLMMRTFSWTKVPMIYWTGARIVEISDERCVVKIPFRRRNRNHLNSLYFAVFIVGADIAGGILAFRMARTSGRKVSFAFKDVQAQFLKRAEGDTLFSCDDGALISRAVEETFRTGERINQTVRVIATTPSKLGDEPVATFELTLSVKAAIANGDRGSDQTQATS